MSGRPGISPIKSEVETPEIEIHSFQSDSLLCRECLNPEAFEMAAHVHRRAHAVMVVQGSVISEWRGVEYFNGPGSFFFLPKQEPHSNRFSNNFQSVDLWLEDEWRQALFDDSVGLSQPAHRPAGHASAVMGEVRRELVQLDPLSKLVMEALAIELLAGIARTATPVTRGGALPKWLRLTEELLRANITSPPSLASIAKVVNVHPSHLTRTFHRYHRKTIGEYVRDLRIAKAKNLLATTEMPLGQVATEVGFCDQSHFSRSFKVAVGCRPSDFRKRT